MPPLQGLDCSAASGAAKAAKAAKAADVAATPKASELNNNNNEPLMDADKELSLIDDLGQRLVDTQVGPNDLIEREVRKREARGYQLVWHNIILIFFFHGLAVWSTISYIQHLTAKTFIWCFFLGGVGGLGVTAGCHRLWSHRAYKARLPLRVLLALCYSVAGQNSIIEWVRDHRVHHKFTETDADPHNAARGFFFAHVGWLMQRKHPEVLRQGRKVDLDDVWADPVVQWHQRYFMPLKIVLCFIIPTLVPVYFWGERWNYSFYAAACVRYVMLLNFTWLVNSAAHMFGSKPYDNRINPAESKLVSLVAMGEGWHNYHHVFPWDYKTSEYSYYFNITTIWIDLFSKIGWAYELKTASPAMVERVMAKHGDGSHPKAVRTARDHHHPEEVTFDEYLRVIKEDDAYTGVKALHNDLDVTRKEK